MTHRNLSARQLFGFFVFACAVCLWSTSVNAQSGSRGAGGGGGSSFGGSAFGGGGFGGGGETRSSSFRRNNYSSRARNARRQWEEQQAILLQNATFEARLKIQQEAFEVAQNERKILQVAAQTNTRIGLEAYCPVCIINSNSWVRGTGEINSTYDGVTYFFPSDKEKETFDAAPEKFVPALGGDCTVCFSRREKRVSGNIRFASVNDSRLYLFPSKREKAKFDRTPSDYANLDIANDGNCIVCEEKMNQQVAGSTEFTSIHHGFRYLFPSDVERKIFEASPAEFASLKTKMASSKR